MASAAAQAVPTRDRILVAAAELLRRQGYGGTGLKQVAGQAEATFGSLYHHFPGGKEELADEVLRAGGAFFLALYRAVTEAEPDVVAGVRAFFAGAGETLTATGFQDACPIATVAGEVASSHPRLRAAAADVFGSWLAALEGDLVAAGAAPDAARATALQVLALLEGAFLLCRTQRTTAPMDAAAVAAVTLVAAVVPDPRSTA